MSDEPELTADQERLMWQRLAASPYITEEERREFLTRAAVVVDTSGEAGRRLNEAIQREREARRSGAQIVTTLPPMVPQQRLDREEQEQLSVTHLPPGTCVAHSVNAAAHITAAAEPLTASGTYSAAASVLPQFAARAVSWDRAPSAPVYVGNPQNDFGRLLSRLMGGVLASVMLSWRGGSTKRISFEIDVPNEMTYEIMVANIHKLSRELGAQPSMATEPGRRRLLKLEEEA